MTRHEADLISAILDESLVPDAEPVLANLHSAIQHRARRRRALAAAAAAVLVAAALTVPWALHQRATGHPQPAATPSGPPMLSTPSAGSTVRMAGYTRSFQAGAVRAGGLTAGLSLWRLSPGADPRSVPAGATATTVNGRFGFISEQQGKIQLVWNYAPDVRASLNQQCPEPLGGGLKCVGTATEMRTLAAAVTFGVPTPVLVPVRMSYLPPGYTLADANNLDVEFDRPPVTTWPYATAFDFTGPGGPGDKYRVIVESSTSPVTHDAPIVPDHQVNGHPAQWNPTVAPGSLLIDFGHCHVVVSGTAKTVAARTEIERIAAGLTVADCANASTWFDGPTAIPGGDTPMTPLPPHTR